MQQLCQHYQSRCLKPPLVLIQFHYMIIQDEINHSYSRRSKEVFERQLSDALIEKIDLECPPSMVGSYLDHILEDIREKKQGVEIEEEKLKKNYTPVAERNLKWYLVRKAIIQEHNLEVNKSEIDEK